MKFNKIIAVLFVLFASTVFLHAQQIKCYKKDWLDPTSVETTALEGENCSGATLQELKLQGWHIVDINVESSNNGLNYTFVLDNTKKEVSSFINQAKEIKVPTFEPQLINISNVTSTQATINIGNLKEGQTGIIKHVYPNQHSVVVANAKVIQSTANSSTLEFFEFDDIKQSAIPTTKRVPQEGDTFILNYLYDAAYIVAPTSQAFNVVTQKFKNTRFLHSDIFATHLKLENEPLPSKETFTGFSKFQNLGTIFFVVNNKVHIVDSKTFTVLHSYDISYSNAQEQLPFYTRVAEINKAFWDIDFAKYAQMIKELLTISEQSEEEYLNEELELQGEQAKTNQVNYNAYYTNLLGL
jgi:hypothetical protein